MKTKPSKIKSVASSDLLNALNRCIKKAEWATSSTTVVRNIRVGGSRAQIQVLVTKDEGAWFDIKHAGAECD